MVYLEKLKRLVVKHGLKDKIIFTGAKPHDQLPEYYSQSDIFVNMSATGSLDKTVLEAMAIGVIPITSNEALEEVFSELKDQLMIKRNSKQLADKIKWAFDLPNKEKESLSSKILDIVKENHNLDNLVDKIVVLFK
jgi:glycosyltransferase involved in cell wall biosynthesis